MPGDKVYGFASGCIARYAVTDERVLGKLAQGMSAEEGATLLSTLFTVDYGLREIGKLKKGEKVLIHAAAGGVGLCAVQVAKALGAEIYATASKAKHGYLRALGISHVFTTRVASHSMRR